MVMRFKGVKAKSLREQVNLDQGRKYYFGPSARMRVSVYFSNKQKTIKFFRFLMKRKMKQDMGLTKAERGKQFLFVLVR